VFIWFVFFPFSLPSLLSLTSHPSTLDITIVIITSWTILNYTEYRDSNNSKGNDGKVEKRGKPFNHFPPNNKLVQDQGEMKKTDTQIQTPTK
jgi:hypothetical protein